jgi:hypothetical protein
MNDSNKRELDKIVALLLSPDMANVQLAWSMLNGKVWESMELTEKDALGYIYGRFFMSLVSRRMITHAVQEIKDANNLAIWWAYVYQIEKVKRSRGDKRPQLWELTVKIRYRSIDWVKNYPLIEFICYVWYDTKSKEYVSALSTYDGFDNNTSVWHNTKTYIMGIYRKVEYSDVSAVRQISKLFGSWTP